MKSYTILFMALLLTSIFFAQKPEPVYGFARVTKPLAWYKQQKQLWQKEVNEKPTDANAWYNYFRVTRNLSYCDSTDLRPREEKQEEVNKIVEEMKVKVPDTFEYNYCKWSNGGNNLKFISYLKRADELANGRTLHLDYMVNWGELERDISKRNHYCLKWYDSGEVSPGLLYYNHNVMTGTKPNAIIFTEGDNDTYPLWILQAQNIRSDVTVLNLSFLHIDEYREKIFRELGVEDWTMNMSDNQGWDEKKFTSEVISRVAANKKGFPVYVSVTVADCNKYIMPVEDKLYLTGLTYIFSTQPVDNMALLKRNFEQNYSLDYIDRSFYKDVSEDRVKACNGNYVVPMIRLFDHYVESGEFQRADWIRSKLLFIARDSPDGEEIKKRVTKN